MRRAAALLAMGFAMAMGGRGSTASRRATHRIGYNNLSRSDYKKVKSKRRTSKQSRKKNRK